MSSLLLTAPAIEPLSLAEAKAFLRVETSDDDDVIGALIAGSRIHVEAQTRRALITQSWRISVDAWPDDGSLPILPAPLQSLTAARFYDFDNIAQALDTAAFVLDKGASALVFAPWALPAPGRAVAGIELDVTVGYGNAAVDVPEPLRQAIRRLVAHWYENRGLVDAYRAKLTAENTSEKIAADLAARELEVEARERALAAQVVIAEQGRWVTALPRPLFAFAFIIYVWKVVVWDRVLGLGSTPALSGDVAQWAMIVLTAYFGGRSLEKVARILGRK